MSEAAVGAGFRPMAVRLPPGPRRVVAPLAIILLVLSVWSAAAWRFNVPPATTTALYTPATWWADRPIVPSPPQVAIAAWSGLFGYPLSNPRSLLYHAGVTMQSALAGFAIAVAAGVALAAAIVHSRLLDRGLLPWVIVSQSIPVLATAPMIVVVLGNAGVSGMLPKALIAASLAFFPVTIGMCKGLRAPGSAQLDLMRTYNASRSKVFRSLRWPSAMPYLFPALKVAMALAITGAIVGELPTGAQAGLGARLLIASYNGLMLLMWATLLVASATAGIAVGAISLAERAFPQYRAGR